MGLITPTGTLVLPYNPSIINKRNSIQVDLRANLDLLDEVLELEKIKEEAAKQRATKKYNTKVKPRNL